MHLLGVKHQVTHISNGHFCLKNKKQNQQPKACLSVTNKVSCIECTKYRDTRYSSSQVPNLSLARRRSFLWVSFTFWHVKLSVHNSILTAHCMPHWFPTWWQQFNDSGNMFVSLAHNSGKSAIYMHKEHTFFACLPRAALIKYSREGSRNRKRGVTLNQLGHGGSWDRKRGWNVQKWNPVSFSISWPAVT